MSRKLVTRDMWRPRFIGSAAWKRNHHYSGISSQQINTQRQLYNDKIISSLILKIKSPDAGFITLSPKTRSMVSVEKIAMDLAADLYPRTKAGLSPRLSDL